MTTYFKNAPNPHLAVRPDWLSLKTEDVLEPALPIIDAHHHLWNRPTNPYFLPDFEQDLACGHNVKATVFIECNTMYRADGPEEYKELGETEFAAEMARLSESAPASPAKICAGIVGCADLTQGDKIQDILEAHIEAAEGRFRGIRMTSAFYPHDEVKATTSNAPEHMMLHANFRAGFSRLSKLGLSYDGWLYHPQLDEFIDLARSFPDTTLVLDHVGAPVAVGPFKGLRSDVFAVWKNKMRKLAEFPNVYVKLSGLGLRISGFDFHEKELPPTSEELAEAWRPYIEACIEFFGPQRCMFASNFPVDKGTCSYVAVWNAFKRITAGFSEEDKKWLYYQSAASAYRLNFE